MSDPSVSIMENAHTTLALVRIGDDPPTLWSRHDESLWYLIGSLVDDDTAVDSQRVAHECASRTDRWGFFDQVRAALDSAWTEYCQRL